jgi:hypothetical protein
VSAKSESRERPKEKAMATCPGKKKNGFGCQSGVYKCKKCGSVGCDNRDCGNRTFDGGKCLKCGQYGMKDRV